MLSVMVHGALTQLANYDALCNGDYNNRRVRRHLPYGTRCQADAGLSASRGPFAVCTPPRDAGARRFHVSRNEAPPIPAAFFAWASTSFLPSISGRREALRATPTSL